jgi:uncharacterized DUF497 family protein
MAKARFDWDERKNHENQRKHGVSFGLAQLAFADSKRVIAEDLDHSHSEMRYYCIGWVGHGALTVRFTYREGIIRIIGAGYWRRGKKIYEEQN